MTVTGWAPPRQAGAVPFGAAPLLGPIYAFGVNLVERDRSLATLRATIAGAIAGDGAGVAVVGEPGIGK